MKITFEMSKGAYPTLQRVYIGLISRTDGKFEIEKETGMNSGSANDLITIFLAMMEGKVYKRAFNNQTNQFLFDRILADYGENSLRNALSAAQQHVDYYSTLNKGNLTGLQRIIDKYKNIH